MSAPVVSVVMAVYNGGDYLRESIESILKQTYADLEFIIINDASTDNSQESILSYKDPRINFSNNNENLGLTKSLNHGLQLAQGQYIARIDADDISLPTRIEEQVKEFESNSQLGMLGTWYKEENLVTKAQRYSRPSSQPAALYWQLLFNNKFGHSTVMLRKKAIDSVGGGYDERFAVCQDYDLWSRLLKNWRISVLERELHVRRITQNSLSLSSRNIEQKNIAREISLRNLKEIVSKQISDRELNDIYDFMELGQYSKDRDFQQMYYNLKKITECFAQKYQNIFSFSDVRYECLKMVLDKQNHWRGYCSSFGFAVQWSFWSTMKIFFSKFLRKMTLS